MVSLLVMVLLIGCAPAVTTTQTGNPETSGTTTGATTAKPRDPVTVTMQLVSPNANQAELDKIAAEISKITEAKFNTTYKLTFVTPMDYVNKMNLVLATGSDDLDIFQSFVMYNQFVAQGYLMPIEDYKDYYLDALSVVGDTAKIAEKNGHTYGIPFMNAGGTGGDLYGFRKDIAENLNLDLDNTKTLDDFAGLLRQIKQAYPDMTPLMGGGGSTLPVVVFALDFATDSYADPLGNSSLVAVYDPQNNTQVESGYLRDNFKMLADYAWQWAKEGLIAYDEVSSDADLIKAGKASVIHTMNGPQAFNELKALTGYEMALWRPSTAKSLVFTNNVWTWSITDFCENPERALEVLNEFYVNADLANHLEWGIEGEHYQIIDKEKGIVDFLEGQHPGNVSYYNFIKDNIPNCYLTYVGKNESPEKWQLYQDFKKNNTIISPFLGFVFDSSKVQNEVAACTNVANKYSGGLLSGQLDPSTEYDKFVSELQANGIQVIIDEAQKQLDQWIADNKN